MTTTLYVGRHRTASSVDLTIPPTIHANSISTVADEGDLVVALRDADTGNPAVVRFGPDAIAALREALAPVEAAKSDDEETYFLDDQRGYREALNAVLYAAGYGPGLRGVRDVIAQSPVTLPACICGSGRSVQCASPRHAVTL